MDCVYIVSTTSVAAMRVVTFSPDRSSSEWHSLAFLEEGHTFPDSPAVTVCYRVKIYAFQPWANWINTLEYRRVQDNMCCEIRSSKNTLGIAVECACIIIVILS